MEKLLTVLNTKSPEMDEKLRILLEALESNWRVEHPTPREVILKELIDSPYAIILIRDILPLYEHREDPEKNLSTDVSKLNKLLADEGLELERIPAYRLIQKK